MNKWTKLLPVILALMVLSIYTACGAAEIKGDTKPVNQAPAVTETKPVSSNENNAGAAETSHDIAAALGIKNVKVTSPGREPVVISGKPSENHTVSARVWETLDLECVSEDQAGHKLTYAWTCNSGKLKGEGSKVIWTAPGAGGEYTITVKVTCDKGDNAALNINAVVKCCGG
jgi:hypothetical protein